MTAPAIETIAAESTNSSHFCCGRCILGGLPTSTLGVHGKRTNREATSRSSPMVTKAPGCACYPPPLSGPGCKLWALSVFTGLVRCLSQRRGPRAAVLAAATSLQHCTTGVDDLSLAFYAPYWRQHFRETSVLQAVHVY
ncbi:hypothetical protein NDU88_001663 [Pleurodeles waltl]|uniref:Uncharacterized protein n=1 Tax=Pleurodeles waltl TaxID=8319 RepID=A0AAV7WPA8_PLEWA|nr:hypothetical protein NDU88_001663 [Pleurodeles waltl]